jgi:pimeloyl-ACP methyl ester carboxylesterase
LKRVAIMAVALLIVLTTGGLAWLVVSDGSVPSASGPGNQAGPTVAPPTATDLPKPDPALKSFYTQKLAWSQCVDHPDDQCATMKAPLDYADPTGETIDLALLRVPAKDQAAKVGSLVVNPGGPGAPGTSYAAGASTYFRDAITDKYDIVGFDPRGTGDSTAIDCLSDDQLDVYLAGDPSPDNGAELADYERESRELLQGCVAKSGSLASHVSTVEAARDMDILRALLGERQLSYFGASYGTKLGATYAMLFPKNLGRFVLDGAVDLNLGPREVGLQQAAGFETALRSYVANCVDYGSCFLGDSVDEGVARIQELLRQIDADPLPAGDRELAIGNAFYGVITPLYNRDYWLYLSAALKQAFDGDGSTLMLLADAYASRSPGGGFLDNSVEANYDINCLDQPFTFPMSKVPSELAAYDKASPTFGRALAYSLTGCNDFTPRATEQPPHTDAAGAAPILVVGTTRDPATPYQWAVALSEELSSAVLVSRDGDGHTGYNAGNECVDTTIESYLVKGVVPDGPVDCPAP